MIKYGIGFFKGGREEKLKRPIWYKSGSSKLNSNSVASPSGCGRRATIIESITWCAAPSSGSARMKFLIFDKSMKNYVKTYTFIVLQFPLACLRARSL
jgi:hypothetical protein